MIDPMPKLALALWGFLLGMVLIFAGAIAATAQQPSDIDTQNGNYFFRDTCGWVGYDCTNLPNSRNGTVSWCKNCVDGSDPAACGGTGCIVDREAGRWRCIGSGSGGGCSPCVLNADCDDGDPCTVDTCTAGLCVNILTITGCPDFTYATGIDGNGCTLVCANPCNPNPCLNGGLCAMSGPPDGFLCFCPCGFSGNTCQTAESTTTTSTTETTETTESTTTTSTTITTTTTTTTTTSTTTTSTGPPFSETFLWAPHEPLTGNTASAFGTVDTLYCDMWVPHVGIASATRANFQLTGASAGDVCGIAVYSANGSTRLFSTGGLDCSGGGTISTTGGAFTLVEGTEYQLCRCSNHNNSPAFVAVDNDADSSAIANTVTPAGSFVATNTCTSGTPPLTTGGSNGTSVHRFPIVLFSTNTP